MRVLGIVPARGGSRRVESKNLRKLGERTLVQRAIDAALESKSLARVVVSSDTPEVLRAARESGCLALHRPPQLCTDRSLAWEYVEHALTSISEEAFDAFCIVQPSSPFTRADDIDNCARLLNEMGTRSVASVVKVDHFVHPRKLKRLDGGMLRAAFAEEKGRMAEHELEVVHARNGSVYLSRVEVLEEKRVIDENDCCGYEMPRERSVDINDEMDLAFAQLLLERGWVT